MINFSTKKVLVPATLAIVTSLGLVSNVLVTTAQAQPAANQKKAKKPGIPRKVLQGIADKMGKPITPDMRKDMLAAAKTHADAVKDADDKYSADLAKITGLTVDDIEALIHPQRTPKARGAVAAAPGVAATTAVPK